MSANELETIRQAAEAGSIEAQERLGQFYVQHAWTDEGALSTGIEWLERAAEQGSPSARLVLGHVYLQNPRLENAYENGVGWYRRAAEQGYPPAQDRLADLYMVGRGVEADDATALSWYRRTAEQAYPVGQCNLAYMFSHGLGTPRDEVEATSWYLKAAAQGEARALFSLGVRFARGLGAHIDHVAALACLDCAARQNYPLAVTQRDRLLTELSPLQVDQSRELAERIVANLRELRSLSGEDNLAAADFTTRVAENFARLNEPAFSLDAENRPPAERHAEPRRLRTEVLSWRPRIFSINGFLEEDECAHLIAMAEGKLIPAQQTEQRTGVAERDAFNGATAIFALPLCDAVIRNIERRIARQTNLPPEHNEPISVLRYEPGHEYTPHVDYFDENRRKSHEAIGDFGGQRLVTFLMYLKDTEAGGETTYVKTGLTVRGKRGMAVMHYNCLPDGTPDEYTLHEGRPILTGEKWIARSGIRERSLY